MYFLYVRPCSFCKKAEEVCAGLSQLAWWSWDPEKIAHLAPLLNAADLDLDKLEEIHKASKQYDEALNN